MLAAKGSVTLSSLQRIALFADQYMSTPLEIMTSLPSPVLADLEFGRLMRAKFSALGDTFYQYPVDPAQVSARRLLKV